MKVTEMPNNNCFEPRGPIRILIIGINSGEPTEFDGKWLAEYDPSRQGQDSEGRPMIAHVRVTDDPMKALMFDDVAEAIAVWQKVDGVREDGKPNRPLTAFEVQITRHLYSLNDRDRLFNVRGDD